MAEGGVDSNLSDNYQERGDKISSYTVVGHDEYFDNACSRCLNDGRNAKAIVYCGECQEEYCDKCLQLHKTFSFAKDHIVLDESQKDKWGVIKKKKSTSGSDSHCEEHEGQDITMYCKDDSSLCCSVCVSLNHKKCKGLVFIPQIAKCVTGTDELKSTLKDVDTALGVIEKAEKTKQKDLHATEDSHTGALNDISKYMEKNQQCFEKARG